MEIGIKLENENICLTKLKDKNNFKIIKLDEKYADCQPCDFDIETMEFNIEKYNARKQSETNFKTILNLTNWFDNFFDRQLTQSQWQDDFSVSKDPYFKDANSQPKTYANIDELKAQAKLVRNTIRKLRNTN